MGSHFNLAILANLANFCPVFAYILVFGSPLVAARFELAGGGIALNLRERYTVPSSYQDSVSPLLWAVSARLVPEGKRGWSQEGGVQLALPSRTGPDGPTSRWMLWADWGFRRDLFSRVAFILGLAGQWTALYSEESTVKLANGTDSTFDFFTSPGVALAFQLGVRSGFYFSLSKRLGVRTDLLAISPLGPKGRYHLSLLLGVSL